jgi:hypothetical protein
LKNVRIFSFTVFLICLVLSSRNSFGYAIGHHCDLIREVLTHEGFSERGIQVVMACNEFDDLYNTPETFMLIDDDIKDEIMPLADKLHYDQLMNFDHLKKNTEMLIQNTAAAINNDKGMISGNSYWAYTNMLVKMGITLHLIQDFYAHSNWAELHVPEFTQIPDATLFDAMYGHDQQLQDAITAFRERGIPKSQNGIFSHYTNQNAPVPQHKDLFKDYAYRANFDNSYRAAFKATLEWVRWMRVMFGDANWENLKAFQWNPNDEDLQAFTAYDNDSGTARYLCLYGGSWKHWKRWSDVQILVHDLDNVPGVDMSNSTIIQRPFLYDIWKPNCMAIVHGLIKDNLESGLCKMIDTTDVNGKQYSEIQVPFTALPTSDAITVQNALNDLQASVSSEYSTIKWIKFAIPVISDNDDGDGWFNINDEDPGSSSDFYVEWLIGPTNKQIRYVESIYSESGEPHGNMQVLKPAWADEDQLDVKIILRDSDKMDEVREGLRYGLYGVGFVGGLITGGIGAALTYFFGDWLMGLGDEDMDINPQDGKDDLEFSVNTNNLNITGLPDGLKPDLKDYGCSISASGHDEHWYGDYTALAYIQISNGTPTTKLRLSVLDIYDDFNQPFHTNDNIPEITYNITANVNKCELLERDYYCDPSRISTSSPGRWTSFSSPCWELTYESYIDDNKIPVKFWPEVWSHIEKDTVVIDRNTNTMKDSVMSDWKSFKPSFELMYHFEDNTITDKNNTIRNYHGGTVIHSGDSIVYKKVQGNRVDSMLFRITVEVGGYSVPTPPEQVVEYYCIDPDAPDNNQIMPAIKIKNLSNEDIPLDELRVRYWYTSEGYQPENFTVDWSSLPPGSFTSKFVKRRQMTGADGYCEIGFTNVAGMLLAHGSTGEIKLRFNKTDWANYTESGDYSYNPEMRTFTENPTITMYRKTKRIFGVEPDYIPIEKMPQPSITVYAKDEGINESNIVKPRIYLRNTGVITIPRFDMRYHFTVENGKTPVLDVYYAPQCLVTLVDAGNGNYYINYHFECPNFGAGVILPDLSGCCVGIHYSDWSTFNKTNDYSNPGSGTFIQTDKIEIIIPAIPAPDENQPPEPPQTPLPDIKTFIKDDGLLEGNFVKPRIYIKNVGTANITDPFIIKYYFTTENGKIPVIETWYAPQSLVDLKQTAQDQYCVQIHVSNSLFTPGTIIPGNDGYAFGIHYSDWSPFNKTNDYSNPGSATWVETNKVEVVR